MALYVNGEIIEPARIEQEAERLRPEHERVFAQQSPQDRQRQLNEWSRENVIEAVLIRQAAMKYRDQIKPEQIEKEYQKLLDENGGKEKFFESIGLAPDKEDVVKEQMTERLCAEQLFAKVAGNIPEPTEKEISRFYDKHIDRFTIPESVRASHIVKHFTPETSTEELKIKIEQILSDIHGGCDFASAADKHSDCPGNGGDLGYFGRGRMVDEFEDVVFNLEPGQISGVFQTQFGYHIAKVIDKKPAVPCPLEQVRKLIVQELTRSAQQKKMEKFIDAEKAKAKIEEK